jgi:hypothetical protein
MVEELRKHILVWERNILMESHRDPWFKYIFYLGKET